MAEVFVSYKTEEHVVAESVVKELVAAGYSVWWDGDLTPRSSWDAEIEEEISVAKAVIVLWSPLSVSTHSFVRNEAEYAKANNKLVPAIVARCEAPLAFRRTQTANLTTRKSDDANHSEMRKVLSRTGALVGRVA